MRYTVVLFLLLFTSHAYAQDNIVSEIKSQNFMQLRSGSYLQKPDLDFLQDLHNSKLVSVRTNNEFFNKSYLISNNGDAISTSFMASSNFSPNDNLIVVSGQNTRQRDSFNPYGAYDMTSVIILSTFNTFISRLKIKRR